MRSRSPCRRSRTVGERRRPPGWTGANRVGLEALLVRREWISPLYRGDCPSNSFPEGIGLLDRLVSREERASSLGTRSADGSTPARSQGLVTASCASAHEDGHSNHERRFGGIRPDQLSLCVERQHHPAPLTRLIRRATEPHSTTPAARDQQRLAPSRAFAGFRGSRNR